MEKINDLQSSAAALYDGGWRAIHKDWLQEEHSLTKDEADSICQLLEKFEKGESGD